MADTAMARTAKSASFTGKRETGNRRQPRLLPSCRIVVKIVHVRGFMSRAADFLRPAHRHAARLASLNLPLNLIDLRLLAD